MSCATFPCIKEEQRQRCSKKMWLCTLKLGEEKSKHVSLAQQNGVGPASFCTNKISTMVVRWYLRTKYIENCDTPNFQNPKPTPIKPSYTLHAPHSRRSYYPQSVIATCHVKSPNKNPKKLHPRGKSCPFGTHSNSCIFPPRIFLPGHPGRAGWSQTS
jgi:hypothetical protein